MHENFDGSYEIAVIRSNKGESFEIIGSKMGCPQKISIEVYHNLRKEI